MPLPANTLINHISVLPRILPKVNINKQPLLTACRCDRPREPLGSLRIYPMDNGQYWTYCTNCGFSGDIVEAAAYLSTPQKTNEQVWAACRATAELTPKEEQRYLSMLSVSELRRLAWCEAKRRVQHPTPDVLQALQQYALYAGWPIDYMLELGYIVPEDPVVLRGPKRLRSGCLVIPVCDVPGHTLGFRPLRSARYSDIVYNNVKRSIRHKYRAGMIFHHVPNILKQVIVIPDWLTANAITTRMSRAKNLNGIAVVTYNSASTDWNVFAGADVYFWVVAWDQSVISNITTALKNNCKVFIYDPLDINSKLATTGNTRKISAEMLRHTGVTDRALRMNFCSLTCVAGLLSAIRQRPGCATLFKSNGRVSLEALADVGVTLNGKALYDKIIMVTPEQCQKADSETDVYQDKTLSLDTSEEHANEPEPQSSPRERNRRSDWLSGL
jgi:hypothetical protein